MPARLPPRGGGSASYGQPYNLGGVGRGLAINPRGAGYGTQSAQVPFGSPSSSQGLVAYAQANPRNVPNSRPFAYVPGRFPPAGMARYQKPGPVGMGWGVSAQTPTLGALSAPRQAATWLGGPGALNVMNPLFGRPGMSYVYTDAAARIGPSFKGAPGSGLSAARGSDRSRGFVLSAHADEQYIPADQFDYTPPTNADFTEDIPKTINYGDDGIEMLGTYRAHDFTPGKRFFTQMRSSAYWQDQSFAPTYRMLLPWQQVGRYNLYTQIQLARPLSPQNYFLGYQTQMPAVAGIGGIMGQGAPLGYGSH